MIFLNNISKSYGKRDLFSKISVTINRGEKIGLVGPNGSGKTTLFSIILGELEPSSGTVQINKGLHIGYLAQEAQFKSQRTVLEEIVEGDTQIIKLKKEKEKLETKNEAGTNRYGDILHSLEVLGFFELEHKAKKVLCGLGFKESDFDRGIKEMSGGWQMRVLLAKLLTCSYDCLLLDEPTNYLDLDAALWFKDYLSRYKGTYIMISHDRDFLDEVTNYTLVLETGAIAKVRGNFEHYRQIRQEQRIHLLKQFNEQEKKIKQLQTFTQRFHAQPNKASQVRAKKRALEKMEIIEVPPDLRTSIQSFHFPSTTKSGHRLIGLEGVCKAYKDIKVYDDLSFEVIKDEKAVLAGANGAGKSTLLKILAGVIDIDKGKRTLGHNATIGYFSQTRMDVLDPDRTVLEEGFAAASDRLTAEAVRTILALFLFRGDDVDKKVKILSGGEKSRLILAKLLIDPPNFLLLDEPTTHLDVDAVEALIKALTQYQGTIVFISHDIHFVRSVANTVFEVKDGRVRKFAGNFDYFLEKKKKGELEVVEPKKKISPQEKKGVKKEEGLELSQEERTMHNRKLANRIKKLRKTKDKLQTELYAKKRVAENPRHGQDIVRYYQMLVEEIERQTLDIDSEITDLESQFL
jgi:ATP-binding cassette subfamily F protein 3